MVVGMKKKVIAEQSLYYGDVKMPKNWEIDRNDLAHCILQSTLTNEKFNFSRTFDKLNAYIIEFINLNYDLSLIEKNIFGDIYSPQQQSPSLLNINPVDLQNSPDYTLLYGVKVNDCKIKINYDNNRRKGESWEIDLKDNMFIMFPSTNSYVVSNNQKNSLNFVQTITYEYM